MSLDISFCNSDILVFWGCCIKIKQTGLLKTTDIYFTQFWRLQVQNEGADRAALSLKPLEQDLFLPLPVSGSCGYPLACGIIIPIPAFVLT